MTKQIEVPRAVAAVLHFANAQPTENTWRRITLGPDADADYRPGVELSAQSMMGVRSLEQLDEMLTEYRVILARWVNLESYFADDAEELVRIVNERGQAKFIGWKLSRAGRLVDYWDTEPQTFDAMLYTVLAFALKDVPYQALHRCAACARFFYDPSKRAVKFCSGTCRSRTTVQHYRARQAKIAQAADRPSKRSKRVSPGKKR